MVKDKQIFETDEGIVEYRTDIKGWVGKIDSCFYGEDEKRARYAQATHRKCDKCGGTVEKTSYCRPCANRRSDEIYKSMEFEEWDGETPLFLYDSDDIYFWNIDDIEDYLDDFDEEDAPRPEDLQLVICKPNYPSEIPWDIWDEELPEDRDISYYKDIYDKVEELNRFLRGYGPISWGPGHKRTTYKRESDG